MGGLVLGREKLAAQTKSNNGEGNFCVREVIASVLYSTSTITINIIFSFSILTEWHHFTAIFLSTQQHYPGTKSYITTQGHQGTIAAAIYYKLTYLGQVERNHYVRTRSSFHTTRCQRKEKNDCSPVIY